MWTYSRRAQCGKCSNKGTKRSRREKGMVIFAKCVGQCRGMRRKKCIEGSFPSEKA